MAEELTPRNRAYLERRRERPGVPLRPLTAAAQPIELTDKVQARRNRILRQGWQQDALSYVQNIPELSFAYRFSAHAASRMRYFPAMTNPDEPDGPPIPLDDVPDVPQEVKDEIKRGMAAFGTGRAALSPIQSALSYAFGVPGEGYLVGIDSDDGENEWTIRSVDEFMIFDDAYKLRLVPLDPQGVLGWTDLDPAHTYAARLWVPDFRFSLMATSPMRALLDVAEELSLLSRDVRASARSRLAGGGILKVPEGLRLGELTDDNIDPESGSWMGSLAEAMMTPLSDEGVASAIVPLVVSGDAESLAQLDHLLIERPYSALAMELRAEAIGRIATGVDVPREVLEGMSDPNHWGAWLVSDDTFRHHIEPQVIRQVDALTAGFLRVWLTAANVQKYWVDRACIWYDPVDLIAKPDPMANALPLWDRDTISDAALRQAGGFTENDAPSQLEMELRMLGKVRAFPPNVIEALMHALDPNLVIPPINASGQIPGMGPKGVTEPVPPGIAAPSTPSTPGAPPDPTDDTGPSPADTGPPPSPGNLPGGGSSAPMPSSPPPTMSESPDPFTSRRVDDALVRSSKKLTEIDSQLRARLQVAACAAMMRALDKAGAKLRTRVTSPKFKDAEAKAAIDGLPNRQVAKTLGGNLVASLGFASAHALIDADWAELRAQFYAWVSAAQTNALKIAADMGKLSANDPRLVAARQRMSDSIAPAWAAFEAELDARAESLLYNPANPDDTVVVDPNTVVLTGMVRRALTIAGGAPVGKGDDTPVTAAAGRPSFDIASAAEYLSTTTHQVRQLVKANRIAHLKIGNRVMFEQGDLDAFLDSVRVPVGGQSFGSTADTELLGSHDTVDVSTPTDASTPNTQTNSPDQGAVGADLQGGIGNGGAVGDMLDASGLEPVSYEWDHGPSMRPFEPHEALDGVSFTSFDDDVLANNDGWPDNDYYFPGDHDGCSCDFSTVWGPGEGDGSGADDGSGAGDDTTSDDGSGDLSGSDTTGLDLGDMLDTTASTDTPDVTLPDWMAGLPDYPYTTFADGDDTFVLSQTNDAQGLTTLSLNNTTATFLTGSGWQTDDPYMLDIMRSVETQAPGTSLEVGAKMSKNAWAAVRMSDGDNILIAKRGNWNSIAEAMARQVEQHNANPDAVLHFMPAAVNSADKPTDYVIAHELGHALHATMGVSEGFARATQVIVDQLTEAGVTFRAGVDPATSILSGMDKYRSATTMNWLEQLGVSKYGQSNLYEVIAETHAQYVLGDPTPLSEAMGEAMGWTR